MKNLIVLFAVLFVMASCHNYKKDTQNLLVEKDSLLIESEFKDSYILEFLNGYNEIRANLDSIKKMEKMVAIQSNIEKDLGVDQKILILKDIQLINGLLQKNKELIASLNRKLKSSNAKIGEHELMLTNLQDLNREKDADIFKLNEEVQNFNLSIGQLSEKINVIETDNKQKVQTIIAQTNEINRAFYAFGSLTELENAGVMHKTGGFLGIGKTPAIEDNFNIEYFTGIDMRDFDYIPLLVKKAKLLSVHSSDSYHITGNKSADTLFIDNKKDFWKATKYLVVVSN